MKEFYGNIPTSKLRLVRALSESELSQWTVADDGQIKLTAQSNLQKGGGGQWLEELGFVGKELNSRNTLHFTLNCAVEDHAYGSFEKDVFFVIPFESMLAQEKPSSFSEVDVVFPFKAGEITCPMPEIWVREGVKIPPQIKPYARTFPKDADPQSVIQNALEAEGCPSRKPSMHGWSLESLTLSEEGRAFVSSLGGQTALSSHSNADEGRAEWALATFAGATKEMFSGNWLYEDHAGRTREHKEKMVLAIQEMQKMSEHATHPNTKEYAKRINDHMLKVQKKVLVFQTEWSAFFENPLDTSKDAQLRVQGLLSQAPEGCRNALSQRMASVKEEAKEHLRLNRPTLDGVLATSAFQPAQGSRGFGVFPPALPSEPVRQTPRVRF